MQAHRDFRRPLTTDTVPRSNRHLSLWLKIARKMVYLAPIRIIQIPNGQSVKVIVVARNIMSATALRASVDHDHENEVYVNITRDLLLALFVLFLLDFDYADFV